MAAASTRWNSGRLLSIRPIVSPRLSPSPASPAAIRSTRSAYSRQLIFTSSPLVRIATRSGTSAAVTWKAPHIVGSWSALYVTRSRSVVVVAISPSPLFRAATGSLNVLLRRSEPLAVQHADVIREPDHEQQDHEREAHYPRPLHRLQRHRAAAHLLHDRPEDVAAVERQEREQVHNRERERDHRHDQDHVAAVVEDRLARDLVVADDPVDLLALLRVDDLDRDRQLGLGDVPERAAGLVAGLAERLRLVRAAAGVVAEAEPNLLRLRVVDRGHRERDVTPVALDGDAQRPGALAAVLRRLLRALVGGDHPAQLVDAAAVAVHRHQLVVHVEHAGGWKALAHAAHLVARVRADQPRVADQEDEPEHEVHRRPGEDHHDPLPHRLRVVGPVADLLGEVLGRVHAADLHVAAQRQGADRVLRLPHLLAYQQRREEQREALHAHADRLGGGEVPQLVEHDQEHEAERGEEPAHVRTPATSSPARSRASASAPYSTLKWWIGRASCASRVRSITSAIAGNGISPSRKACTATSFAAFMAHGAVPPAWAASRASRRHGNASSSGGSKVSEPTSVRSSAGTGTSARSG